jgi:deazaflavin-dependent oxidoreductase (nitroreductase family)
MRTERSDGSGGASGHEVRTIGARRRGLRASEAEIRLRAVALTRLPHWFTRRVSSFHRNMLRLSGGRFLAGHRGEPMILLTTTGRKSGKPRTWPLMALRDGDGWIVTGSNGGHDQHPAWYLNLLADPEATVTARGSDVPVRARVADDAERAEQYPRFVALVPGYADYERATTRVIPVVFLEPRTG